MLKALNNLLQLILLILRLYNYYYETDQISKLIRTIFSDLKARSNKVSRCSSKSNLGSSDDVAASRMYDITCSPQSTVFFWLRTKRGSTLYGTRHCTRTFCTSALTDDVKSGYINMCTCLLRYIRRSAGSRKKHICFRQCTNINAKWPFE